MVGGHAVPIEGVIPMLRRIIEDFPMNTSLYHRNVLHEDIF